MYLRKKHKEIKTTLMRNPYNKNQQDALFNFNIF